MPPARARRSLVAVNCGAIPENLVESELFGHVKGAFTGAVREQARPVHERAPRHHVPGRDRRPAAGDAGQAAARAAGARGAAGGAAKPHKVDVRVISASNRKLADEVAAGRFREDLYYRLNVVHLALPPLAERREDIALLAQHFMRSLAQRYAKPLTAFAPGGLELLTAAPWPGNVRQLQNVVEKCVVLCRAR
jgi:two-component system response regulator GlrR